MSYSFGWWEFADGDEPQMVCRDSDERIVMVGQLSQPWLTLAIHTHPDRPRERWKRFEYRHADFCFPLIVNWQPEEGRILLDYNLSSRLWREETSAETEHPPYGGWIRVDDMVPDAFWCWPGGVFENELNRDDIYRPDWGVCLIGKWDSNGWENSYFSREVLSAGHWTRFDPHTFYYMPAELGKYEISNWNLASQKAIYRRVIPKSPWSTTSDEKYEDDAFYETGRTYYHSAEEAKPVRWDYVFDTLDNVNAKLDELGSRIKLPEVIHQSHEDYRNNGAPYSTYLKPGTRARPFLLRSDGRQAIQLCEKFGLEEQTTHFAYYIDGGDVLLVHEICAISLNITELRNDNFGLFINPYYLIVSELSGGKFQIPDIQGYVANRPDGLDIELQIPPELIREAGLAFQCWPGVDPALIYHDGIPIMHSEIRSFYGSKSLSVPKFKHLLGYKNLHLMMGTLAGSGCRNRHRQLGTNWETEPIR